MFGVALNHQFPRFDANIAVIFGRHWSFSLNVVFLPPTASTNTSTFSNPEGFPFHSSIQSTEREEEQCNGSQSTSTSV